MASNARMSRDGPKPKESDPRHSYAVIYIKAAFPSICFLHKSCNVEALDRVCKKKECWLAWTQLLFLTWLRSSEHFTPDCYPINEISNYEVCGKPGIKKK